jgi:Transcriptional regulator
VNKYEIRTQKKKDAIIEAALSLFRKKGYTNASINEIAAMSGVSSVSIYNYFGSKEELVRQCAAVLLQGVNNKVIKLLAEKIGFKEKLLQAVSLCAGKPFELMEEYFSKEALDDKVFVELFHRSIAETRLDIFQAFIESGKKEEVIDGSISTETIMDFLGAVVNIQNKWETQNEYKAKSVELYQLVLYGLIGH